MALARIVKRKGWAMLKKTLFREQGRKILFTTLLLGFGTLAVWGCGGSDTAAAQTVGTSVGSLTVGDVANVYFGSASSAEVSFTSLEGGEEFVVAFYSLSSSAGTSYTGTLQNTGLVPDDPADSDPAIHSHDISSGVPENLTEEFHNTLRNLEKNISLSQIAQARNLAIAPAQAPQVGAQATFNVLNSLSGSSCTSVTANVIHTTSHFVLYRDVSANGYLSDADIIALGNAMETYYKTMTDTFGNYSDVDGSGKFNYLFTPVVNSLGGGSGIVTGFWYAVDLYPGLTCSNSTDIAYISIPDPSGNFGVSISQAFYKSNFWATVPHELQHDINYNAHVLVHGASSSDPGWMNEGLSHNAEQIANFNTVSSVYTYNPENPSRAELGLATNPVASFIGGTGLAQRGMSYLYLRYLYEQYGTNIFYNMINTDETGLDAIEAALGLSSVSTVPDFFTAVYLSNLGLNSSSRYNFTGIDLRATQDDNRGTVLDGPTVTDLFGLPKSSSISSMSSAYYQISGSTIRANGNRLTFSGGTGMSPGVTIIRVE